MAEMNKPELWAIAVETLGTEQVGWNNMAAIVIRTPAELAEVLKAIAARTAVPAQANAKTGLLSCGVCGDGQLYCNSCGTGFAVPAQDCRVQMVPKYPDDLATAICRLARERGTGFAVGQVRAFIAATAPGNGEHSAGAAVAADLQSLYDKLNERWGELIWLDASELLALGQLAAAHKAQHGRGPA